MFAARDAVLAVHMAPALEEYLTQLVLATRDAGRYGPELQRWIAWGGSPRATIALDRCARAHAWLSGRDYVAARGRARGSRTKSCAIACCSVTRPRRRACSPDQVIDRLLDLVPLP